MNKKVSHIVSTIIIAGVNIVLLVIILVLVVPTFRVETSASSGEIIPSEDLSINKFTTISGLKNDTAEQEERIIAAKDLEDAARRLGYTDDSELIKIAHNEWQSAQDKRKLNTEKLDTWTKRFKEYPVATYVWLYLKDLGYNNYVCAGIIGNLMAEVGGGTLNLQYWLVGGNNTYYGMCQWHKKYYPDIWGANLKKQCNYLANTIEYELNTYGYKYASNYKYKDFLKLKDEQKVALMFAQCYERCNSQGYSGRQRNATVAYEYFTK